MANKYEAAKRGFAGLGALLDPDTYAGIRKAVGGESFIGTQPEKNFQYLQGTKPNTPAATSTNASVRSSEQAALNERLLQQGVPPAEILRREQLNKK